MSEQTDPVGELKGKLKYLEDCATCLAAIKTAMEELHEVAEKSAETLKSIRQNDDKGAQLALALDSATEKLVSMRSPNDPQDPLADDGVAFLALLKKQGSPRANIAYAILAGLYSLGVWGLSSVGGGFGTYLILAVPFAIFVAIAHMSTRTKYYQAKGYLDTRQASLKGIEALNSQRTDLAAVRIRDEQDEAAYKGELAKEIAALEALNWSANKHSVKAFVLEIKQNLSPESAIYFTACGETLAQCARTLSRAIAQERAHTMGGICRYLDDEIKAMLREQQLLEQQQRQEERIRELQDAVEQSTRTLQEEQQRTREVTASAARLNMYGQIAQTQAIHKAIKKGR